MKKTKLFLGGYISTPNAQNLNCLALAKYLDKTKFDIHTMVNTDAKVDISDIEKELTIYKYNKKLKFTKVWLYIKALLNCDVLYLPKQEKLGVILLLNKFFKRKLIVTIEGILDDLCVQLVERDIKADFSTYKSRLEKIDHLYSMTPFVKRYNFEKRGLKTEDTILYIGTDCENFKPKKRNSQIKNTILIGLDLPRKGIADYAKLAALNPTVTFNVVGNKTNEFVDKYSDISNMKFHGVLSPGELNDLFNLIDLHILPSKTEGFPKVVIETAAVGIPSLLYSHYGANELLNNNEEVFVVDDFQQMNGKLKELIESPSQFITVSKNVLSVPNRFSWGYLIKSWERVFRLV